MAMVEVDNLRVRYGKLEAVKGISFAIPQREVFGFIGPNGAGKSTTIKVLATLLAPTSGTARIDGLDVPANPRQVRRKIGYVPDFFGVYEDLTVQEYLHFFAAAYGLERSRRVATVGDVLQLTELSDKLTEPVDGLSRGMKQRLSLARVLLHDPQVLLLDEPASGLDPRARIEMRELLKALRGLGKTILISSHILHELSQLCTRIGIVEQGRLVAEGSLQDIYRQLSLLRLVHVQVTNLDGNGMLARIEQLPGVARVERQVDRLAISLHEDQVPAEQLLHAMIDAGCRIRMFQPEAMDMETVFMKLTEGKTA
jgi:ABC-2 type transport system ATP-binding protein